MIVDPPLSQPQISRSRIFLIDVDEAKNKEWVRRRKLRLQQVRQQARDIARNVRQKVNAERKVLEGIEHAKRETEAEQDRQKQKIEEQKQLNRSLSSVGSAHKCATHESGVEAIVREKLELQDALARARGAVAQEKVKFQREALKQIENTAINNRLFARKVESARAALISSLPPVCKKPSIAANKEPAVKNNTATRRNAPNTKSRSVSKERKSPKSPSEGTKPPKSPKTALSKVPLTSGHSSIESGFRHSVSSSRLNQSLDDADCFSDDSVDTWPPRSIRTSKTSLPPKVKLYNHNERKCTEYFKLPNVSHIRGYHPEEMEILIREEETAAEERLDANLKKQVVVTKRGQKALLKENSRREFEAMIDELSKLERKERMERAIKITDSVKFHTQPEKSEDKVDQVHIEPVVIIKDTEDVDSEEEATVVKTDLKKSTSKPPVEQRATPCQNELALNRLLDRLNQEKDKFLHRKEFGPEIDCADNSSYHFQSDDEIPEWFHCTDNIEKPVQKSVRFQQSMEDENVDEMVVVDEASEKDDQEETEDEPLPCEEEYETVVAQDVSTLQDGLIDGDSEREPPPEKKLSAESTDESMPLSSVTDNNNSVPVDSSCSDLDIFIQVRNKKGKKEDETRRGESVRRHLFLERKKEGNVSSPSLTKAIPPDTTSSSTSYYSPPAQLSPEHRTVLNNVLSKIKSKNTNPLLHQYINRLLDMSKSSVTRLNVSSSDVSVPSDIFQQTPPKVVSDRVDQSGQSSFVEDDDANRSTQESLKTARDSEPEYFAKRLVDMIKLIYDYQLSFSSSSIDETKSSYRSMPGVVGHHDVIDALPEASNLHSQDASPESTLHLNLPTVLMPKPFTDEEISPETHLPEVQPVWFQHHREIPMPHQLSVINEVPTKLELDISNASSKRVPERDVFESLSDLESVLSSIPSSPSKCVPTTAHQRVASGGNLSQTLDDSSSVTSLDLLTSRELMNSFLDDKNTNSSSDLEEFRSRGLGWALATLRRTRDSKNLSSNSSSSVGAREKTSYRSKSTHKSKSSLSYQHSTPVKTETNSRKCSDKLIRPKETEIITLLDDLTPPSLTLVNPFIPSRIPR